MGTWHLQATLWHVQPSFAPIELRIGQGVLPKEAIDARIADAELNGDKALPPISKPVATEAEKRRLQAVFQFKGGKALPDELTLAPVVGHLPLDVVSSASAVHKRRAAAAATAASRAGSAGPPVSAEQALHALIMDV